MLKLGPQVEPTTRDSASNCAVALRAASRTWIVHLSLLSTHTPRTRKSTGLPSNPSIRAAAWVSAPREVNQLVFVWCELTPMAACPLEAPFVCGL